MENNIDKNFYKFLNDKVKQYTNNGTSLPQAVSLVSKQLGMNPYKIMHKYYPTVDNNDNNSYNDVKTKEGSFVTLKGDTDEIQYEVININNKDAIVLRNTDNNEEITASENELTPVITESRMKKVNEAQYSVSINGLETQDANALSQLFTAASQAESSSNSIDMVSNPMPIDMDSGLPMDMNDAMAKDSVIDDIEFDEELPSEEPISLDNDTVSDDSLKDDTSIGGFDPMTDVDYSEETPFGDEHISDMPMDDMMDDGMFDDEIAEALKWAGVKLDESEQIIPGDDFIDDEGQVKDEQDEYAEDITDEDDKDEIKESVDDSEINQEINLGGYFNSTDTDLDNAEMIEEESVDESNDNVDEFMSDYFYDNAELQSEYDYDLLDEYKNEIYAKWKELVKDGEDEWVAAEDAANEVLPNSTDKDTTKRWDAQGNWDEIEESINAILRNAGVKLDEEVVVNAPKEMIDKSVKKVEKKEQEPEYKEVDTDTFGKESSEGSKKPLNITCESTVNKDKIKSIYETAKSMYAKKDVSEWNSLDRRYIEKLIKEGCSYSTSTKMLMEAKKGK